MFYTVLQRGNTYRAGDAIDVVCYDAAASNLRVRVTGDAASLPANIIQILVDGSSAAPNLVQNASNSTSITTQISIDSTDLKDYFLVRTINNSALYNRELIVEALGANDVVLKSERFYIHNPDSRYKKVSYISSFESALADYTARLGQIRAMRSKSYTWRIDIVVDPPPAPEIHIALPPTQVFGIESVFEPRPYGQGFDMVVNAQLYVPFAVLSPAVDRLFTAMLQRVLDRQESGVGAGRGVAMVEFYNEDYSLVINDVPIATQMKFNANGLETNANENASGILMILTGRSMLELVSGFTHKKPV